jgi:subtilisin family serine protease
MQGRKSRATAWEWGGRIRQLAVGGVAVATLAALSAPAGALSTSQPGTTGDETPVKVVVREQPAAGNGPETAVVALGGQVGAHIDIIDAFVATVPERAIAILRERSDVTSVTEDAPVHLNGYDGFDPVADKGSTYNAAADIGADSYWAAGYTGQGVDVALIDSGVARVTGLNDFNKVVNGPDLSFESYDSSRVNVDTFGHGTHMASLIAGRDPYTANPLRALDANHFTGIAPDARIVSIKIADRFGETDVIQVLMAINWIVENHARYGFNIRVLNLSFGTDGTQDYRTDPLTFAAEAAWKAGIAVVVSAGNTGDGTTALNDPAYDPYVISVGADNTNGTVTMADDAVAPFSAVGTASRHPDLLAPGKSIVGLRSPGSTVVAQNPGGLVGTRLLRGSGTSQAAAITSGAAALIISQRPWITPDQLKALLMTTANKVPNGNATAQGAGLLDLKEAKSTVTPNAVQTWTLANGTGTLDGARGSAALTDPEDGNTWLLMTLTSNRWSSSNWSSNRWSSNRWSANRWSSNDWN